MFWLSVKIHASSRLFTLLFNFKHQDLAAKEVRSLCHMYDVALKAKVNSMHLSIYY